MNIILYITGACLLLVSTAGYIYVKLRLNPKDVPELDDYYWEFEEQHPAYAKYLKWSKITLAAACTAALLLFIAALI